MRTDVSRREVLRELRKINENLSQGESENHVCILWDVENVTPSSESLFVDGLVEYASKFGRMTIAKAFGNWRNNAIAKLIPALDNNSFELIHVHIPKRKKNSSDMVMISQGIEIALQYTYLDIFILITGDSDFRPLVNSLRRSGKQVHIVCDNKNVAESLLALADSFIDYRELIPGGGEPDEQEELVEDKIEESEMDTTSKMTEKYMGLLAECIQIMENDKISTNIANVKVKMKLLNPLFNEKSLGFSQWSKFVERSVDQGFVTMEGKISGSQAKLKSKKSVMKKLDLQKESVVLLDTLEKLDKNGPPDFHAFSEVNQTMKNNGFNFKDFGYKQFKKYIQSLESRNVVVTKVSGLTHSVKRVKD